MPKLADTFNEYGTPVTLFRCDTCEGTYTVCPAVADCDLHHWINCLATTCASYDPALDVDKLFDEGRVYRVGDRSHIRAVESD